MRHNTKKAQKNITGMKVYDWASAFGPAFILENFPALERAEQEGLKTDAEAALIPLHM